MTRQPTTTTKPTIPRLATTASSIIANAINIGTVPSTRSVKNVQNEIQQANTKENAFGTTFGDLALLNSLVSLFYLFTVILIFFSSKSIKNVELFILLYRIKNYIRNIIKFIHNKIFIVTEY